MSPIARDAGQEFDQAGRAALQHLDLHAIAIGDRWRHAVARRLQPVEHAEEERQVARVDALFVQRQDEAATGGVDQIIAVLDALGDALGRNQLADVVTREETAQRFRRDLRVDGHVRRWLRGRGAA
jgi:hypothetical protein